MRYSGTTSKSSRSGVARVEELARHANEAHVVFNNSSTDYAVQNARQFIDPLVKAGIAVKRPRLHTRRVKIGSVTTTAVRRVVLPSAEAVPALGQGTWHMAEDPNSRAQELAALRLGLELGLTLIDTAEMYADGAAEELVGEAISGHREEVFLVSKVLPQHATRRGTILACERSLKRLGTDRLDLFLLHWRGGVPLQETLEAFHALQHKGLIRYWGVSNFDVADMEELASLPHGPEVSTDQVLYNLNRRGIEYDLLPWCSTRRLPIMAYSPVDQGRLTNHTVLEAVAAGHAATPAQVALAWVLRQQNVIAIPKSGDPDHLVEDRAALDLRLTKEDLASLDLEFPPPTRRQPLEML